MNSVERVKAICKERRIPISKVEKDLGFSNGYIGQLRKGVFPADRLALIAEYLGVSSDFLMTGKEKTPTETGERQVTDKDIQFALFGGSDEITEKMYDEVKKFAAYVKQREGYQSKE